ncbi:MAG: sugar ABC transporter substrate-binding protein [Solirubrobacterales bacterium]
MNRKLRWLVVPALAAIAVVALAACGSSGGDSSSSGGGSSSSGGGGEEEVSLAYFSFATANTLAAAQQEAIERTAGEMNASVKVFDGKGNPETQLNQVETAANTGQYDAFVIFPTDGNALVPAVQQAIANGVKVVSIFSTIGKDPNDLEPQVPGLTSTVATEIDDSGEQIGRMTIEACKGIDPCEVAYMPGVATFFPEVVRQKAFEAAIADEPNVEVVATQNGDYAADPAMKATQDILQSKPGLDVIATSGDQMTAGAAEAVKSAGKAGEIALIGDGASRQAVKAIRAGEWFGSYVILPETEGELGAQYAIEAVRGKSVPSSVRSIDKSPIGPVATKQTVDGFSGQWND